MSAAGGALGDEHGPIEAPASPDRLYLARGLDVDPYRPVVSGDVFRGHIDALGGAHEMVLVISHPCSMRMGPHLRPQLQVAPVVEHSELTEAQWRSGSFRIMPLPQLADGASFAASLDLSSPIRTSELRIGERVCCLSEYGILVLYQRHIRHLTRLEVGVRSLEPVTRAIFTEISLQDEWNQGLARIRVEAGEEFETVMNDEAQVFENFMRSPRASGASLRDELIDPYLHAAVRRAVAQEIQRRSS
jgi:hypothetical protein